MQPLRGRPGCAARPWALGCNSCGVDQGALRDVWAAQDKEPRKLAHVLSDETYSLRDLVQSGKMTMLNTAGLHKKLDIKGVSLNDMYFKSWDKDYLDKIVDSFKANGRAITC